MIQSVFKYITGIVKLRGGTDNTIIGNSGTTLNVNTRPYQGTVTHSSATVTSASSTALAANSSRRYIFIQNNTAQDFWIRFDGAATAAAPSIKVVVGAVFSLENSFVTTQAVTVIKTGGGSNTFSIMQGV